MLSPCRVGGGGGWSSIAAGSRTRVGCATAAVWCWGVGGADDAGDAAGLGGVRTNVRLGGARATVGVRRIGEVRGGSERGAGGVGAIVLGEDGAVDTETTCVGGGGSGGVGSTGAVVG